ncbi:MAG TPA: CoA transferase, partial [Hyphomicrobiaceae bacterium]|nr:CoA transferase [Hyphomicrobiaceae bacterium]
MAGALDDILVLDLTRHGAGALATMFLGDNGARVVRLLEQQDLVLRTGGFRVWDRGKECIVCCHRGGLHEGKEDKLAALIKKADVLVEDYPPSERPLDLAHDRLAKLNPRLVSCSITGYGEHGPYRDEPAVDELVLARAGVLSGLPGFRPAPVYAVHPLPSTGAALLAALGIAAALYQREVSGLGQPVATSLLAGALIYHPKVDGEHLTPNAFQTNPYGSAPFYSVYQCADGEWIQLGCVHAGFIARAARLMEIGELLADPVYGKGILPQTREADGHLRSAVARVMNTRSYDDWAGIFEANDIPFARSRFTQDGLDDPQVRHNEMVVRLNDPEVGPIEQMGAPIKLSATPGRAGHPRSAEPVGIASLLTQKTEQGWPRQFTDASTGDQSLPLSGVRVLEITNLIAGPIAGRLLADLGADVMKLEPPQGDMSRPIGRTYFYSVNYAKRSVCIDTATPDGKGLVARIAATCDVLLANLRPGATKRMGIGNHTDPRLIEVQISGYGLTGPYAHRPGIDPLAQALMGLQRAQGGDGNPPSFPAQLAPTDFTTGTMAALGTVLALLARRRGAGTGQCVDVNLLDGGIVLSSEWFTRYENRPERPLVDKGQYGTGPFHRLYEVTDGFLFVSASHDNERQAMIRALEQAGASG